MEDDVEELASSGGPPVSHGKRAQWNDANNACLLELCIEQCAPGMYNGAQMSGEDYQAVVDGLLARRRLVYTSPPQGMKETVNHAHAKVRNVIERSFGVLKMKFRILLNMFDL